VEVTTDVLVNDVLLSLRLLVVFETPVLLERLLDGVLEVPGLYKTTADVVPARMSTRTAKMTGRFQRAPPFLGLVNSVILAQPSRLLVAVQLDMSKSAL